MSAPLPACPMGCAKPVWNARAERQPGACSHCGAMPDALRATARAVIAEYTELNDRWEAAGPVRAGGPTELAFKSQMVALFSRSVMRLQDALRSVEGGS